MKTASYRNAYTARGPKPFQFNNLLNEHSLIVGNFFESILLLKSWRGGGELSLKNVP